MAANEAFEVYRELYYEGGVGSTYFWDLDDGFAGVVLLKKGMFWFDVLDERRERLTNDCLSCGAWLEKLGGLG